jgi:hypothetical protein
MEAAMRNVLAAGAVVILSLLVTAAAAAMPTAQPTRAEETTRNPLPKEKLLGTRLVDSDANFSMDVPAFGWRWVTLTTPGDVTRATYAAEDPTGTRRFLVLVLDFQLRTLLPSFLAEIKKSQPDMGDGLVFEDVAVPEGAKRFRFDVHTAVSARTLHCEVYLVATGRPVELQVCSPDAAEPAELPAWLASFRTIYPVEPAAESSWPWRWALSLPAILFAAFRAFRRKQSDAPVTLHLE